MKKTILILLAFVLVLPLASCGVQNPYEGKNVVVVDPIENISEYTVVRGENCTENEKNIATKLHKGICNVVGEILKMSTDYTKGNAKEILVGTTSRKDSKDALTGLKLHDFVIRKYGERVVIVGGSELALETAVDFFLDSFTDSEKKVVKAPRDNGYVFKADYAVENLTINGLEFSSFKVLNNSFLSSDELCERFELYFGFPFESQKEAKEKYRLLPCKTAFTDRHKGQDNRKRQRKMR